MCVLVFVWDCVCIDIYIYVYINVTKKFPETHTYPVSKEGMALERKLSSRYIEGRGARVGGETKER